MLWKFCFAAIHGREEGESSNVSLCHGDELMSYCEMFFLSPLYHRASLLINILIRERWHERSFISQYRMPSVLRAPQCLDWAVEEPLASSDEGISAHKWQWLPIVSFSSFMSGVKGGDVSSYLKSMWVLSPLQQVALRHDGIFTHLLPVSLKRWGIDGKVLQRVIKRSKQVQQMSWYGTFVK